MSNDSGRSTSPWMSVEMPSFPALTENQTADVCIVGAGIAGITTAYLLSRRGKSVVVLDDGPIGGGETGRTTAHLSNAVDDRYIEIERLHGEGGARIVAESHSAAIETIERIVREEEIDCDFRRLDGYLFAGPDTPPDLLRLELEAAHRAGLEGADLVDRAPISSFNSGQALRFPGQGEFHPLRYLRALAAAIAGKGGKIFTGAHVDEVEGGESARVRTRNGFVVSAGSVVVATNSPINDRFAIHTKQAPYRTYAIGARIPRGTVEHALYWDTLDPYHYIRLAEVAGEHQILIIGGEDQKTGDDENNAARHDELERWGREHFPAMGEIEYRWSGQVMEPIDGVAFIGRNPADADNIYVVTGDSGMGMTHGTIAGMLISDLIDGTENRWADLYDPSRITLRATGEFLREGADVVKALAEWLTAGEVESAEQIPPGSGAIIRRGLKKIAAYRAADGTIHEFSAACTHLGCVLAWNPVEGSWDCPCHGSRFGPLGKVINGPATGPMERWQPSPR